MVLPYVVLCKSQQARSYLKTVYNTGSCFGFRVPVCGFRVPVVCNAPAHYTTCSGWGVGALQKKVMHYKKLVPETRNKNQCYCRPQLLESSACRLQRDLRNLLTQREVVTSLRERMKISAVHPFAKLHNRKPSTSLRLIFYKPLLFSFTGTLLQHVTLWIEDSRTFTQICIMFCDIQRY